MVSIFGLPTWEIELEKDTSEIGLVGEMASHSRLAARGDERLILDGETWRSSLFYKRTLTNAWSVGVEVPLVRQSGGVLDDVIDAWHSLLNLSEGNRNFLPEGQLDFLYDDREHNIFGLHRDATGLGDTQVSISRMIGGEAGVLIRAIVKLPTGDADMLAGSGATDISITALSRGIGTWRGHALGYYWGAGLMRVGSPDYFSARNEDWVVLGVFGGSWKPFPSVGIKAQLDFHSRFYDSALDEFGKDSIQASIGGWWAIDDRRRLNFAINEDLIVRTAPDVSLHLDFSWAL